MSGENRMADYRVEPEMIVAHLRATVPFDALEGELLGDLARRCRLDFFPKGTRILTNGESFMDFLFLIQRGAVNKYVIDDHGDVVLRDVRGEGQFFGALALIQRSRANVDVEAVEDTFCILLPKRSFYDLLDTQPSFAGYFLKDVSDQLAQAAYHELRQRKLKRRPGDDLLLFTNTAGDVIQRAAVLVDEETTIQDAASLMARQRIGSLLIHAPGAIQQVTGIVTDRDLRVKVVAAGLDYQRPVSVIMSSPVRKVLSQSLCFDVLLLMLSQGIHHLAVEQGGRIVGIVTSSDIMSLQGSSPFSLLKEIAGQDLIAGLYPLAQKIPDVIRHLVKEGGKASHVTRMIAIINDQILDRLLTLLERELGEPPLRYCWMLMGSEGRREQTFKTDQDNALLYEDPDSEQQRVEAREYFAELTSRAVHHLVNCGYPPCPGDVMASNPRWCQPMAIWRSRFNEWVSRPNPQELLQATIFFDFKAGYGDVSLVDELRSELVAAVRRQDIFLLHLARQALSVRAPLSFFRNFIVEKDGQYRNRLDIKHKGIAPYVDVARILALKYSIRETNTLARFRVLADEGYLDRQVARAAESSYELMMQLRLIHQLEQMQAGILPDNHIDPANLTDLERRMLKESFRVLERLHGLIETLYPTP